VPTPAEVAATAAAEPEPTPAEQRKADHSKSQGEPVEATEPALSVGVDQE
jgi:hypothetical protein